LRDIFIDSAIKLINNQPIEEFASVTNEYCKLFNLQTTITPSNIQGSVLYEDDFGNLITSITKEEFEKSVGKNRFSINLPSGKIEKINNTYDDVKIGDAVCFFNSMGLLEIANVGQSASKLALNKNVLTKFKIDRIIVDIL
jgi:S-adenosylmethionine hydrolase